MKSDNPIFIISRPCQEVGDIDNWTIFAEMRMHAPVTIHREELERNKYREVLLLQTKIQQAAFDVVEFANNLQFKKSEYLFSDIENPKNIVEAAYTRAALRILDA